MTTAIERKKVIDLTFAEVRRLYDSVADPIRSIAENVWKWSTWRREHQATARFHHYRTRGHPA